MNTTKRLFSRKDLTNLIIPLIAERLLAIMIGLFDSIMVSSAGESAVSGVSLIDIVFQLILCIFSAFGTGGSVITGQYLGAKDREHAQKTVSQLVWGSFIISLLITGLAYLLRPFLLNRVFGSITQEVYKNANIYLLVMATSIPAISLYESGCAIFHSMGNSKITLTLSLIMNVTNIAGNALMIYVLKLGVFGAAIASVFSRYLVAFVLLTMLTKKDQLLHLEKTLRYKPDGFLVKKILSVAVPSSIENALFQLGKIILASLISTFGTVAITANAITQTISFIQVVPGSALGLASITIISRCVGAEDIEQAKYYHNLIMKLCYVLLASMCILMYALMPIILKLYNLSDATADLTLKLVLMHTVGAICLWPISFVNSNSLHAAGDVKFTMIVAIISMWVFRVISAYILAKTFNLGVSGVWLAMFLDWLCRAAFYIPRWHREKWAKYRAI